MKKLSGLWLLLIMSLLVTSLLVAGNLVLSNPEPLVWDLTETKIIEVELFTVADAEGGVAVISAGLQLSILILSFIIILNVVVSSVTNYIIPDRYINNPIRSPTFSMR